MGSSAIEPPGSRPYSGVRKSLPATSLSAVDQVRGLLDLATDPGVLFRIYVGWQPWL
jgi:phosphatidylinositol kinase/protein kinase (PI-3  family)